MSTTPSFVTVKEQVKVSSPQEVSSTKSPDGFLSYHILFPALSLRRTSNNSYVPFGSYFGTSRVSSVGLLKLDVAVSCLLVSLFTKVTWQLLIPEISSVASTVIVNSSPALTLSLPRVIPFNLGTSVSTTPSFATVKERVKVSSAQEVSSTKSPDGFLSYHILFPALSLRRTSNNS